MDGWIKLHRKIADYDGMFRSQYRFTLFCWLLLHANREGKLTTGRFQLAIALHIKPSSVYKSLKWLQSERIVDMKSNNKMTTVSICKWGKYQQQSNNKVTTKEQQSNTLLEYKNRESNNIYTKPEDLTEKDFQEISTKYKVPLAFVKSKFDDLENWLGEKPGRGKGRNLRLTLMNWVKRDALTIKKEDYDKRQSKSVISYYKE